MQLLAYQGCIKPQLWAIKSIRPFQTLATLRLPNGILLTKINLLT